MKLQGTCDGARGSVDWRGAHADAYQRTSLTGGWKLLEQGPEKSGCFCDLLRWSVGRHWLLRSRWTYFRQWTRTRQSALTLIALEAKTVEIGRNVLDQQTAEKSARISVAVELRPTLATVGIRGGIGHQNSLVATIAPKPDTMPMCSTRS